MKTMSKDQFVQYRHLLDIEANVYQAAADCQVPRIPQLVAAFTSSDDEACLVME